KALANFSFGQGNLTATPLQIAAMVNAIASGGIFRQPTLYAGQTDRFGRISVRAESRTGTVAISQKNAALLRSFMESGVTDGTGRPGKPMYVQAAAKTATAQTGHFTNGKEDLISWYAGFFPVDSPKYVVVVMNEGGDSGGRTCGPVFKKIADSLYPNEIDKPAD
ncbi:MAG: penicillin-binding transpeptidase domain-containing protein, partial [Oscillospiraceae bacterium]|nr:penicillin-binding transpeptidase domain-containing protein [Oscillospiraceae bacterium]